MKTFIRFINVILAALLAGTSFGIWLGFNPATYTAATYIEQQRNLVHSLNTLMVSLVIAATLVSALSAVLNRKHLSISISFTAAALLFASCLLISRFGNLPLQNEMMNWNAERLPGNWTSLRDKWWTFHVARTIVELLALILVAWSSVQPAANRQEQVTPT